MKFMPARNSYFDDMFDDFFPPRMENAIMKTDIFEKDGKYDLEIELPGYKKEEIKMEIKSGYLTISAAHSQNNEEKDAKGKLIRGERMMRTCSRSFYIGDTIKAEDIEASYNDGVLSVICPTEKAKAEETKQIVSIK